MRTEDLKRRSAEELRDILRIADTQMLRKAEAVNTVTLRVRPQDMSKAVRTIRENGILCRYEQYIRSCSFTVMKTDLKRVYFILQSENVDCEQIA